MNTDELRAFVRTVEAGGISGAATMLGMGKSNVSRLVSALETKLNVRLLQRSPRGSTITEEGRALLGHARTILYEIEAAEASVARLGEMPRGLLRVTAPHTFGANFLAPLLPRFLARVPELRVELQLTSRHIDLVEEGVDVALRIGAPVSSALVMRRLAPNPILLCAAPEYIDRHGAPTSPDELAGHVMLLLARPGQDTRLQLSQGGQRVALDLQPKLASNDPAVVVEAALAALGIAETPLVIARDHLAPGRLVEVLSDWRMPETDIYALFPSNRGMVPRVRVFLDFLVEMVAPLMQGLK